MSSDPVHALEGLRARVATVSKRSAQLVALRDQLADDLGRKEAEVVDLSGQIDRLAKVVALFRLLMDQLVAKQVQVIEGMVTEGLQSIFSDLDLRLEADIGVKYNKVSIEFFFRRGDKDSPLSHRGKPLDSFGGGPSSVASLTLRVLTMLRLKLWPFLALDETLGAVSDEYTENAARFLKSLAKEMGLDVLFVTHKPAYLEHSDRAYRCLEVAGSDNTTKLEVRSVG